MMQFTDCISARAFGLDSDKTVLGFKQDISRIGRIVPIDPAHSFDPDFFEALRLWWEWNDTRAPLYISGPTGCGKTSGVMQFLARVGARASTVTCRARMDKNDLIGSYTVCEQGGFIWQDGPASAAWRHGLVLVINEFTLAPPEVWVSANDILEGDALVNDRTGEVLARHPNTRVIITDNTAPGGDATDYLARNDQDASVIDRCWHIRLNYPDAGAEAAMLEAKLRPYTDSFGPFEAKAVRAAVRFARKSWESASLQCSHSVSCRVLERFLGILFRMKTATANPSSDVLEKALSLALTAGLSQDDTAYLQQLAHFEFASLCP